MTTQHKEEKVTDERGIQTGDKIENKDTAPKGPKDNPPDDPHEVTDRKDKDSADGRVATESRMKERDRQKSLASMEKQAIKKKKAEIKKKEMKTKSKEDNHVDERETQGGDRKENNPTGSNELKITDRRGGYPSASSPMGVKRITMDD